MSKKLFSYFLLLAIFGFAISCNSTKTTATKEVVKTVEKPKKDNNVYNLMGNSLASARTGIAVSKKYGSKTGTFKVSADGGAQQVGIITYFMLDEAFEITLGDNQIDKKFLKDDFSLDYKMNGERQLSHEYGKLNGVKATFTKTDNGIWQISNKEEISSTLLADVGTEEAIVGQFQTGDSVKLRKSFYPTAVKVGDSWNLQGDDLKWILDGLSSSYEASGTMKLKEVVVSEEDEEPIAIIELNCAINYVSIFNNASPPLKKQLAFKGEVRRSLKDYIDKEVTLNGSYNIARVKPAQGDVPKLDIDIQSTGTLTITEEVSKKK